MSSNQKSLKLNSEPISSQYRKLIDVSKGDQTNHQYVILVIDDM